MRAAGVARHSALSSSVDERARGQTTRAATVGARRPFRHLHMKQVNPRVVTCSAVADSAEVGSEPSTFYDILGVPPNATSKQVKAAYYAVMRDVHPDLSAEEDATEYAAFLNDVYSTLIDPDLRAAYDAIMGVASNAVNPFKDNSYEKDKVFVDEYTCIGCRACACVAPKTFGIEEQYGRARVMEQGVDSDTTIQEAMETCPVECIHWVSAPQLSLLEAAMTTMERKDAFILQLNGGATLNVFFEASLTWERRASAARAAAAASKWEAMWQPSGWASTYQPPPPNEDGSAASDPNVRRRAASSVAAAERKWRDVQRMQRQRRGSKPPKLLMASVDSSTDADD